VPATSHNNLFLPYQRHPEDYEDPLSRAAVLVMRLVPLAYQSFLDLACRGNRHESVALLPRARFMVQRTPSGNETAERLLSVFLTPNAETPSHPVEVRIDLDRGARHDGFIQHESELIVVIEAKRHDQEGWQQAEFPGKMDIEAPGTVRFVKWVELVDRWIRLTEVPELVGHAEREVISDFLELVTSNPQINATSNLARCRAMSLPLATRLQALLGQALKRPAEARSGWGPGGELTGLGGPASVLALSLHDEEDPPEVRLQVWAAIQAGEANAFYGEPKRLKAIAAKQNARGDGRWTWHVWPVLQLKSQRDSHHVDLSDEGDLEARLRSTAAMRAELNRMVPTSELAARLGPFVAAGLATQDDVDAALVDISRLGFSKWKVAAPVTVHCTWSLEGAIELDNADNPERNSFVSEVRKAAGELTELVGTDIGESA